MQLLLALPNLVLVRTVLALACFARLWYASAVRPTYKDLVLGKCEKSSDEYLKIGMSGARVKSMWQSLVEMIQVMFMMTADACVKYGQGVVNISREGRFCKPWLSQRLFPALFRSLCYFVFVMCTQNNIYAGPAYIFDFPVDNYVVKANCNFQGVCARPGGHAGEDIMLSEGTPVKAVADGVLAHYGCRNGYGELLAIVDHDLPSDQTHKNGVGISITTNKVRSIYGHIRKNSTRESAALSLKVGDVIRLGDILGYVNDSNEWESPPSNCSDNKAHNGIGPPHLHFGIGLSHFLDWDSWGYGHLDLFTKPTDFIYSNSISASPTPLATLLQTGGEIVISGKRFGFSGRVTMYSGVLKGPMDLSVSPPLFSSSDFFATIDIDGGSVSPPQTSRWSDTQLRLNVLSPNTMGGNVSVQGDLKKSFLYPLEISWYDTLFGLRQIGNINYPFKDVPRNHWAACYIMKLWRNGIANGQDGLFKPSDEITRAEFLKLVMNAAFCPSLFADTTMTLSYFKDLDFEEWQIPYVMLAVQNGIVKGSFCPGSTTDRCFYPNKSITRSEAASILAKSFSLQQVGATIDFPDAKASAYPAVSKAASNKGNSDCGGGDEPIISGFRDGIYSGYFRPDEPILRDQAAKIIAVAMSLVHPVCGR